MPDYRELIKKSSPLRHGMSSKMRGCERRHGTGCNYPRSTTKNYGTSDAGAGKDLQLLYSNVSPPLEKAALC